MSFVASLTGCQGEELIYAAKQGLQQGSLLLKAKPIRDLLDEKRLGPEEERQLRLVLDVTAYAKAHFDMHVGRNYQRFVSIDRPWVTQLVVAAQPDKLEPVLFKFPIVGAFPYKGFFDENEAIAFEKSLQDKGLDTYRREVEAFSTAGWLPDPLISTMLQDDGRLIEVLFHELTHATFWIENEADFNEAFASWFGYHAALEYIAQSQLVKDRDESLRALREQADLQIRLASWTKRVVDYGKKFYASPDAAHHKKSYFNWMRTEATKEGFKRAAVYDWNNASILALSTYYEQVPKIQSYIDKRNLSLKDALAFARTNGKAMVSEISLR